MRKPFLLFLAVTMYSSTLVAQGSNEEPSSEVLQSCLLGTADHEWSELKLTYDQQKRIKFVQEACAEECKLAGAKKDPNSISNADGSTILSEVENILTPEQYDKWVSYCKGDPVPEKK